MSRSFEFYTLDVFTDAVFGGNPLAVLPDARGLSENEMARITSEFNLSETVFVFPPKDATHTRHVRIFTPGRELPFAGHPTVGTAYLLAHLGVVKPSDGNATVILEEGVGPVSVAVRFDESVPHDATLTAAGTPEFRHDVRDADSIAALLSIDAVDIGAGTLRPQAVSCGVPVLIAPLRDAATVSRAKLDRGVWERTFAHDWATEVYLFDASVIGPRNPVRARMFAPALGISEDPATGSAAACLAAYLATHAGDGDHAWTVHQGVEMGRPSVLDISARNRSGSISDVRVGGSAVLVSHGTMELP